MKERKYKHGVITLVDGTIKFVKVPKSIPVTAAYFTKLCYHWAGVRKEDIIKVELID